ncbi:MAG: hypothetical protein KID00_14310 [Clostridium argentinense]|uniref:Comf operon protein A, DNA transporter ATPase n=1 Tax=Clostridium faecium TaxID=2762223 RepID=A0ABR8YQY1_9CLOT|nr:MULTISPECIES: hypothetical protein [Clostridium]MBD8046663.1 hypothetical protein [Clostridium faecium]MBS5824998.1 hypothetical protein [Clostridium argentinense]MDU1350675.1 hypothetical protein [Clostridium argentinense]
MAINVNMFRGKEEVSQDILKYCQSKHDRLNVISYFYNTATIFLTTIFYYLNNNKSIVYITNEDENKIEILNYINKEKYIYLKDSSQEVNDRMIVCSYNRALYLEDTYDLVIFDDLGYMPLQDKKSIERLLIKLCDDSGIAISYSIESVFLKDDNIYFPMNKNKTPLIEPRVITTRIDINEDLPLAAYEYLNWAIFLNRRTIIYVPDKVKVLNIYGYMDRLKEKLTENIYYYIRDKKDRTYIKKFLLSDNGILITDDYDEFYEHLNNLNVMVFFADDKIYDYKTLVYITSKVERAESLDRGEVIFLCKEETEEIDKAKSIMRELNRKAWEEGFLKF